jgi:NAD(P)-dependent dehydrogenase (short-subunit alcohol dehydrogenase family)
VAADGRGRHVVVTGASTGIGRAAALHLESLGFVVHAGVRRDADAEGLAREAGAGLRPLLVDVTDAQQVTAAAGAVAEAAGSAGLWGLVNNAGVAVPGPLEFLPLDDWRRQLEVNLTGQVLVTQALLGPVRAARGRIVNVTSIGGLIAFPFMAAYHAAKFGLEAVTDSLRRELRPWGIHVCAVEPGSVATKIWERGQETSERVRAELPAEADQLYGPALDSYQAVARKTGERGIDPIEVARVIEHALTARRPHTRYLVGRDAKLQARLAKILPDRLLDAIIAREMSR